MIWSSNPYFRRLFGRRRRYACPIQKGTRYRVIGRPGQGTHSFSAPPHNWQSDNALDLAVPSGTLLVALANGRIRRDHYGMLDGDPGGRFAGRRFYLLCDDGNEVYYAHCSAIVAQPGARVKRGDVIARSGVAAGVPHLHIGLERGNPSKLIGGV